MTDRFRIKYAQPSDIEEIASVWRDAWRDAHASIVPAALVQYRTHKQFAKRVGEHLANTRIATINETILGFCIIRENQIYQLFVSAPARGTVVAHALIEDGERRLWERGDRNAFLHCAVGNDRAAQFYLKNGWTCKRVENDTIETLETKFEVPAWRFEKSLNHSLEP